MTRHNTMRPIFCTLAILYGAMSMARAGPVILAPAQMDAVTAGGAVGNVVAAAVGPFAFTGTSANAVNYMVTLNGQPSLAGYAAGSEAVGSATAVGAGSATGVAATTASVAPGTQVVNYTINANQQIGSTSVSGSATMSFGSFGAGPQVSF